MLRPAGATFWFSVRLTTGVENARGSVQSFERAEAMKVPGVKFCSSFVRALGEELQLVLCPRVVHAASCDDERSLRIAKEFDRRRDFV